MASEQDRQRHVATLQQHINQLEGRLQSGGLSWMQRRNLEAQLKNSRTKLTSIGAQKGAVDYHKNSLGRPIGDAHTRFSR